MQAGLEGYGTRGFESKTLLKFKLARCKPSQHGKWFLNLDQTLVKRHVSPPGFGCAGR